PFCKTQLVQLQQVWPALEAEGIALFAVSYDAVGILTTFAATHGITFPLLSDEGSAAIRRLGLLNEGVAADHAVYGIAPNPRHDGVRVPGAFALAAAGVVFEKRFHESYRVRDTGAGLVARALGIRSPKPAAGGVAGDGEAVGVRAWVYPPSASLVAL